MSADSLTQKQTSENLRQSAKSADKTLRPRPIELARAMATRHGVDFEKDLRDYQWPNGVIVDLPDCFAIAYVTATDTGEWAWFVKTAVGDLAQLLLLFPVKLPYVAFHREKTGKRLKIYRTDLLKRMARKVQRLNRKSPTLAV